LKKRSSFVGQSLTSATANDIINKQPVYELSLLKSNTNNSKKPHKLRPLGSSGKLSNNTATSVLQIESAYQKEIMREIEDDLNDYLDTN
jgi:hypothetical protein